MFFVISVICLHYLTLGFFDARAWEADHVPMPPYATYQRPEMSRQQDHGRLDHVMGPSSKFEDLKIQLIRLLKQPSDVPRPDFTKPCESIRGFSTACKTNCSRPLSGKPEVRLWDLLTSSKLTLTAEHMETILSLTESMPENDIIVLSASSANHYNEMQAMFQNLHTVLLPRSDNVSLVLFDIGLTEEQRTMTEKNCRCLVLSFPFENFPLHTSHRNCYAWKPLIVFAAMQRARNLLIYQDASIRWTRAGLELLNRTTNFKLQLYRSHRSSRIAAHTVRKVFDYFGEEPCAFTPFPELHSGFTMFRRDDLIIEAILKPWARCALEDACMCPAFPHSIAGCVGPALYHRCHRFDQSALGMITGKLFNEDLYKFTVPNLTHIQVQRGHQTPDYFNPT